MRFLLTICFVLTFNAIGSSQETEITESTTHYYFIRHAEKDKSDPANRNPHLTEEGRKRASNWSNIFNQIRFDAVYSTQYHRTIETATPTADKNDLEIQYYNPRDLYSEAFKKATKGKTVLIVGHSNTTPAFVNAILGEKKYESIDESNNGNLYIVSLFNDHIEDQVLTINAP